MALQNTWKDKCTLQGKVAIITGATRGIGRSIALTFAELGADIVVTGRTVQDLEKTAAEAQAYGVKALVVPVDVSDAAQVRSMVDRALSTFQHIDVLVNNAGIVLDMPFTEMTNEQWKRVIDVNVNGVFYATKAVVPQMISQRAGKIINISSMDSIIGVPNFTAYCASKGAVSQFTKALAAELARYQIQVNAICPGYVRTSMSQEALADEEIYQKIVRRIPLHRVAEPEEVAWLAAYLASDLSNFMTGQLVVLDGGQTIV